MVGRGPGGTRSQTTPSTPARPFGAHRSPYNADGIIFPGRWSRAQLDAATASYYDAWKQHYLEPACDPGEFRVHSFPASKEYTVSEGHGYGMVAVALMAGHDPNARAIFDGLIRYYRRHPTFASPRLMAWAQDATCHNVGGSNSATDGDLDIAYGLLLAEAQWGNGGDVDYGAAARDILDAILKLEVTPAGTLLVGDWVSDPRGKRYRSARGSDFIPAHMRTFRRATGDARRDRALEKTYALIDSLRARFSPATGLLPDFIVEATGDAPRPAPPNFLERAGDGQYSWNACRVPWRVATDYLVASEPRAREEARVLNAWLRTRTGNDPKRIIDGYALDGGDGVDAQGIASLAFVAPFLVSAMIEPLTGTNQLWLDALWAEVAAGEITEYYGDSIKLFAMILASGNWWTP